jgi:leader peptidase (prepilin peptidase)/N-methyltransferase
MMASLASLGLAGVAGLALGSFAVTAGLRMARGESVLAGRSRCDGCGRTLGYAQTAPLVSYVRLGGACLGCGARIDPLHPVGEAAGALVVVSAFLGGDLARGLVLSGLGLTLIVAAAMDARTRRLPDSLTMLVGAGGRLGCAPGGPATRLIGGAASLVTILVLLGLRELNQWRRGDPGLGLGDVKLMGALAIWLGTATPWAVVAGALLGLLMMAIVRPADRRLPFGPAIAAGAWIVGAGVEGGLWPMM